MCVECPNPECVYTQGAFEIPKEMTICFRMQVMMSVIIIIIMIMMMIINDDDAANDVRDEHHQPRLELRHVVRNPDAGLGRL